MKYQAMAKSPKITRVAAVVAVSLCAFTLSGPSAIAASESGPVDLVILETLPHPEPGHPIDVEENYTKIDELLLMQAPTEWGGAYVAGDTLVVLTVTRSIYEAEQVLRDIGIQRGVTVVRVRHSMADLYAATNAIVDNGLPGNVSSIGPQYSQNALAIGVSDGNVSTIASMLELPEVVGLPVVAFANEAASSASRWYDSAPFTGGRLTHFKEIGGGRAGCSSAFPWVSSAGNQVLLTAAHCYKDYTGAVRSLVQRIGPDGTFTSIGDVVWSSGNGFGTILGRHGDLAVWRPNAGGTLPRVFVGANDTQTSRTMTGTINLPENWSGTNLRTSGAGGYFGNGTGAISPDWVSLVDQEVTYFMSGSRMVYSGISFAEDASECIGHGDSGGAVFLTSGTSDAKAVGVISGSNFDGGLWTNCRSFFTPIKYVTSDFGGHLSVG